MKKYFEEYNWYCDNCGAHLNNQKGFTSFYGTWICKKCGYENDVTENNVLTDEENEIINSTRFTCPICEAHMIEESPDDWVCPECGFTRKGYKLV